jgi:uroporphyrinogen-III synthase
VSRPVAVLRPQPGNAATVARLHDAGLDPIALPLFAVVPLAWSAPDPATFDALLLTSANAVRHGGDQLRTLSGLPVFAVGTRTAEAAQAAGLRVVHVGNGGAAALVDGARVRGITHALHLSGRDRTIDAGGSVKAVIPVYASAALPVPDATRLDGTIALIHSARAGQRFGDIAHTPSSIVIVAISAAAAAACGPGWRQVVVAAQPNDDALIAAARAVAD